MCGERRPSQYACRVPRALFVLTSPERVCVVCVGCFFFYFFLFIPYRPFFFSFFRDCYYMIDRLVVLLRILPWSNAYPHTAVNRQIMQMPQKYISCSLLCFVRLSNLSGSMDTPAPDIHRATCNMHMPNNTDGWMYRSMYAEVSSGRRPSGAWQVHSMTYM